MILAFLTVLALLGCAVLNELERRDQREGAPKGKCGGCGGAVEYDWLVCPACRNLLRRRCAGCRTMIAAFFSFCPHCGHGNEAAS